MDRECRQMRSVPSMFDTREENDVLYIEGYFSVFNTNYDLWPGASESVAPGAFSKTLGGDIRALIDHETRLVLGRNKAGTLELKEDSHGLWGRVSINRNDQDAMNLYERVKRGDVTQCSFGFDIVDQDVEYQDGEPTVWIIKRVRLYEVSVVPFPAYEDTGVSVRRREFAELARRKTEAWKAKARARLEKTHGTA